MRLTEHLYGQEADRGDLLPGSIRTKLPGSDPERRSLPLADRRKSGEGTEQQLRMEPTIDRAMRPSSTPPFLGMNTRAQNTHGTDDKGQVSEDATGYDGRHGRHGRLCDLHDVDDAVLPATAML